MRERRKSDRRNGGDGPEYRINCLSRRIIRILGHIIFDNEMY